MAGETDPDIAEVIASELQLLERDVRASPDAVKKLFDPEFREFGASGRVWDLDSILTLMGSEDDYKQPPTVDRLQATRLAADVILLTYRSRRPERTTMRSSLWRRFDGGWRVLFHQGTVQPTHMQEP